MSLPVLAQHMAAKGRGPDSMLVHMSPQEVAGLHALALKHGGTLTINPETGLVEAGFLSSILPMVAGFALDAFLPGVGSAIGGALGTSAAVGTGIAVGGLTGLATGSLSKGLVAGLGAYGGAGISQGLLGAGASALGTDAFNAANTLNAGNPAAVQAAVEDKLANATFSDKLAAGFDASKANPMGFIKPNAGYLAAAAAPVIADQMVPTTVKAPPLPPAYIRPFQFDANTRKVTAQTPVLASEWGTRSFPDIIPKTYDEGGIVALAGGGDTTPKEDPFAKYNTMSGASKAAYDYLMGNTASPTGTPTTPRTLTCPAGFHLENGACVPDATKTTTPGTVTPIDRVTAPIITTNSCGEGYHLENGVCVPDKVIDTSCPVGFHSDGAGNCIPDTKTPAACPAGQTRNAAGVCVPIVTNTGSCPPGQTKVNGVCVLDTSITTGPGTTTTGPGTTTTGPGTTTTGPGTTTTVTTGPGTTTSPGTDGPGTTGPGGTNLPGSSGLTITTGPATTAGPTTATTSTTAPGAATSGPSTTGGLASLATFGGTTDGGTMGGEKTTLERQFGDYKLDPTLGDVKVKNPNDKTWGTVEVTPVAGENDFFSQPGQYIGGYYNFTTPGTGGGGGGPGAGGGKYFDDQSAANMAFAAGGMPSYGMGGLGSLGGYSDGGRLLKGPGDGVSDSIPATIGSKGQPARLADGEFVVPARIVSELGNGSTDAGARKLYAMMDRIQKARGKTVGKGKVAANSRADKHLPA